MFKVVATSTLHFLFCKLDREQFWRVINASWKTNFFAGSKKTKEFTSFTFTTRLLRSHLQRGATETAIRKIRQLEPTNHVNSSAWHICRNFWKKYALFHFLTLLFFLVLGGTPHFKQLLVCLKAKPKLES